MKMHFAKSTETRRDYYLPGGIWTYARTACGRFLGDWFTDNWDEVTCTQCLKKEPTFSRLLDAVASLG